MKESAAPKRAEWKAEWTKWVHNIHLGDIVMEALEMPTEDEQAAFEYMQRLTRDEATALLEKRQLLGLLEPIMSGLDTIRKQYASSGAALAEQYK